jgi:hypothetical protein
MVVSFQIQESDDMAISSQSGFIVIVIREARIKKFGIMLAMRIVSLLKGLKHG